MSVTESGNLKTKPTPYRLAALLFVMVFAHTSFWQVFGQNQPIRIPKTAVPVKPADNAPLDLSKPQVPVKPQAIEVDPGEKKDLWLAVGLGLAGAGAGHLYLGRLGLAAIMFFGTYGFIGVGTSLILSSFQSRTVRVDGEIRSIEEDTNRPLLLVGILAFSSGVLFFLGSIISVFVLTEDYNRRIERIERYQKMWKKQAAARQWFLRTQADGPGERVEAGFRAAVF